MIKAILACDEQGGIGLNGTMPWPHNKQDMQWFKDQTTGHIVVMGSKTWKSPGMPKPLPRRYNVVVTSKQDEYPGANEYLSGDDISLSLQKLAQEKQGLITWIIGGANLINQCWSIIDEFYITRIPGSYNCDTSIDLSLLDDLFLISEDVYDDITFQIYKRIRVRFP